MEDSENDYRAFVLDEPEIEEHSPENLDPDMKIFNLDEEADLNSQT